MKRVKLLIALAAGTVLLLGACGSDDDPETQDIDSTEETPADDGSGDSGDAAPCMESGDLTVDGEGVEVDPEGEGETRVEVGDNSVVVGKDGSVEINGEQYAPGDIEDCEDAENPDDSGNSGNSDDSGSDNPDDAVDSNDSGGDNPDDSDSQSENPDTNTDSDGTED